MRRKRGRDISGIFLVNKPKGLTSNQTLQKTKRMFNAAKAGHTGSLDPLATGVLPICFGNATKLSQYLLDAPKSYIAEIQLGITTNTGDAEGQIVNQQTVPHITTDELDKKLNNFRGDILQIPPMYSALKNQGQPLYKLARQGIEIVRQPRPVTISCLKIACFNHSKLVIEVDCSKGTYIRTLAEDIGEILGCGAHITALQRTQLGPFNIEKTYSFAQIEFLTKSSETNFNLDMLLLKQDVAVNHWPMVHLTSEAACKISHGQKVQLDSAHPVSAGMVRLYNTNDIAQTCFLGIGELLENKLIIPKKIVTPELSKDKSKEL